MFGKKNDFIWVVKTVEIWSYGSYVSTNQNTHICSSEKEAIEYVEEEATIFEMTNEYIEGDACKMVRFADDPKCKIVIARTFNDREVILERRIFAEKKYMSS